jgi:CubicO group peptidase (beta-lactamase class C family)
VYDEAADRIVVDSVASGDWSYSGTGYVVLQRALEGVGGRGLDLVARERLFAPLGLSSMTYRPEESPMGVRGHDRSGAPLPFRGSPVPNAGSSLRASALDYARFLLHVAGIADAPSPSAWIRLARPRTSVRSDLRLHWGLGWALERDLRGGVTAFHWGSNPGFKSFALVDPERELGLVILTNGDHGLELVEEVVGILDPKPHPLFEFYMLHPDD